MDGEVLYFPHPLGPHEFEDTIILIDDLEGALIERISRRHM